MATARDIIKSSLRLIGALATGETPSADEANDALSSLNNLLDSWANEKLLISQFVRETFTLIPGQQTYTVGPTGDFVTTRPVKIENAGIMVVQATVPYEAPVEIVDYDQWSKIVNKQIQIPIPSKIYAQGNFPNETINFWPVPSVANQAVLYSRKQFTSFTNLSDDVNLLPGYIRALNYNLAMEIAPEYGKEPSQAVVNSARESKENIKRTNIITYEMEYDDGLTGRKFFNIFTGQ